MTMHWLPTILGVATRSDGSLATLAQTDARGAA